MRTTFLFSEILWEKGLNSWDTWDVREFSQGEVLFEKSIEQLVMTHQEKVEKRQDIRDTSNSIRNPLVCRQ